MLDATLEPRSNMLVGDSAKLLPPTPPLPAPLLPLLTATKLALKSTPWSMLPLLKSTSLKASVTSAAACSPSGSAGRPKEDPVWWHRCGPCTCCAAEYLATAAAKPPRPRSTDEHPSTSSATSSCFSSPSTASTTSLLRANPDTTDAGCVKSRAESLRANVEMPVPEDAAAADAPDCSPMVEPPPDVTATAAVAAEDTENPTVTLCAAVASRKFAASTSTAARFAAVVSLVLASQCEPSLAAASTPTARRNTAVPNARISSLCTNSCMQGRTQWEGCDSPRCFRAGSENAITCMAWSSFKIRFINKAAAGDRRGTRACAMKPVQFGGTSVSVRHTAASQSCAHTAIPWLYPRMAASPTRSRKSSASRTAISGV
mmetsp:Transcript_18090/g.44877  ORF Transcript_18090/g.44877 Transcript_18090/m.44877 type:complete len:373 (+) Transcript_18090:402-1520(+)